ncbi:MAG TPA: pitrilysin family protein [Candidatus Acidoferrales bacterium]|nr:pitrilysin family protein [Candidatus Acidoferrales bacterium]
MGIGNLLLILTLATGLTVLPLRARSVLGQDEPREIPSRVERKNKAPVSNEILRVRLPKPTETTLANGLTVLILEDHRQPLVHAEFHLRSAGALFEPESLPGLASATAKMLREGTRKRTSRQIAEDLDRLGASVEAGASFGAVATVFTASGLAENFDRWFPLAVEILLEPSFPAAELKRLKDLTKVQLRQQRARARFLAAERFNRAVYGNHPAAVASATVEAIDALSPEMLANWHRERYSPQDAVLAFAGDVDPSRLLAKLQKWLAGWRAPAPGRVLPPHPRPAGARRVYLVDRPDSVQTTLAVGNIAIDRRSPDYVPVLVMNQVLGGGVAGRLFLSLREEKGYTYGAYSSFTAVEYPGAWSATTDVRTEVTEGALKEILNEIRRIRDAQVGDAELADAKRAAIASFALALEQPSRVLGFALLRKFYNLPEDYWDHYPAMVAA